MATMNISLPDPMKEFIEAQAASEGFGSTSEYLRSIIRDVQKRQAKQVFEGKLREAIESGPPAPMTRADWDDLENRVWERHHHDRAKPPENCLQVAERLGILGSIKGLPADLTTNPDYMEGFGRD